MGEEVYLCKRVVKDDIGFFMCGNQVGAGALDVHVGVVAFGGVPWCAQNRYARSSISAGKRLLLFWIISLV